VARYVDYSDLRIGATTAGLISVIDLSYGGSSAKLPPPKVQFIEATDFPDIADGGSEQLGKPVIRWIWDDGVDYTGRHALRSFMTTAAHHTSTYIDSPDALGDIKTWLTVMRWPVQALGYQSFDYSSPFTIEFFRCVEQ
jgi:hypothetical protein